jgi:hypothetical protein
VCRSFIVLVSLSFTTCFGVRGHLQVCRIFLFSYAWRILLCCFFVPFFRVFTLHVSICVLPLLCCAKRHIRKETTKITKENSTGTKHKWKRAECDHVEKSSEAESFRHMKIKISYTPEDGHVGRNMLWKTVKTNTIKLHADGNITCKTHWTIQCSRILKYSTLNYQLSRIMVDGNHD